MDGCVLAASSPDEDLVRRWIGGEEDAFSQLYHRYRRPVMSTAYRIIRNPEEAQDVTQEIFLKFYRTLPDWDPRKSKLSTWLYRLAANHAIDRWRGLRRRNRFESSCESLDNGTFNRPSLGPGNSPYSLLAGKELATQLHRLVHALPGLQRRFFILRYYHGLRFDEIALVERRSIGTVKGLLFRACRTMRRRLGLRLLRSKHTSGNRRRAP